MLLTGCYLIRIYPWVGGYRPRVSNSILSSVCNDSGSIWATGGRRMISGPPP